MKSVKIIFKSSGYKIVFFLFIFIFIASSCNKKKKISQSGTIEGTITDCSDSLIIVQLHPDVILDTIKIVKGRFLYKYPTVNYKRVKMTPSSIQYQRGWCRSDKFRTIKLFLVEKTGKLKQIMFQNSYFDRPYSFDAITLDNSKIKMSIFGKDISHTIVTGSPLTDIQFKVEYNQSVQDRFYKLTRGKMTNYAVIKEVSNQWGIEEKIYEDRKFYSIDSLRTIYNMLGKKIKDSKRGQEILTYINSKK